jgi:ABC-type phosphate transport system substrate-binding protein
VIFYNKTDTAAGGLGNLLPTNINDTTAAAFWAGLIGINDQLIGSSTGSPKPIHVVAREPVSGTYNTFEWQLIHTRDHRSGDFTQEYNFGPTPSGCFTPPNPATFAPPTTSCANPMNVTGSQGATYGGFRTRAIGTGEMVNAVNSANNPNSIGYAFWGLGTFGGKANIKYMTLDGVDPIYPSYATNGGNFPTCSGAFNLGTFSCTGALPTFDNVKNGNYRVWSTIRAVIYQSYTPPSSGPSVNELIQAAQDQAHVNIPDLVPSVYCANAGCSSTIDGMPGFRTHYPVSGKQANNGTTSPSTGFCASDQTAPNCFEEGGDMAGKAFFDLQDQDYFGLTGNTFFTWIE